MNLTDLKNKTPTASQIREDVVDFYELYNFARFKTRCCIIKTSSDYALCTMNCSLIRENYPIDSWQIDCRNKDRTIVIHYFYCLVSKLLPESLRKYASAPEVDCYGL